MVPFTAVKMNAVMSGVANLLGDGILASDIALTVTKDFSQVALPALSRVAWHWKQACSERKAMVFIQQ